MVHTNRSITAAASVFQETPVADLSQEEAEDQPQGPPNIPSKYKCGEAC